MSVIQTCATHRMVPELVQVIELFVSGQQRDSIKIVSKPDGVAGHPSKWLFSSN